MGWKLLEGRGEDLLPLCSHSTKHRARPAEMLRDECLRTAWMRSEHSHCPGCLHSSQEPAQCPEPPLPPQVQTKSRQPCPELPACHTQPVVPSEQGPKDGDCPDCESSTSPGIHLKDNVRLRETSRHFGQHLEGSQWCLGLCFWKPSAGGGDRGTVPKTSSSGNQQQGEA